MYVMKGLRLPIIRRTRRERGATLVLVSILLVALLGIAAISVDFAIASNDKAQAQNAADAAALAIARECAVRGPGCSTSGAQTEVAWAIGQNSPGKTGTAAPAPSVLTRQVTVAVQGARQTTFARVLGDDEVDIGARATASWDQTATGGVPNIPMGIGYCDWFDRQGTIGSPGSNNWYTFTSISTSGTTCQNVPRFAGKTVTAQTNRMVWFTRSVIPGVNLTSCSFSPNLWDVYSDIFNPGLIEMNSGCDPVFSKLEKGQIIMMPIYAVGNWTMPWVGINFPTSVAIIGFAPFKITDFRKNSFFNIQVSSNDCRFPVIGDWLFGLGNCTQIRGQFVRTARPIEGWTYSNQYQGSYSTDLGAVKATLID